MLSLSDAPAPTVDHAGLAGFLNIREEQILPLLAEGMPGPVEGNRFDLIVSMYWWRGRTLASKQGHRMFPPAATTFLGYLDALNRLGGWSGNWRDFATCLLHRAGADAELIEHLVQSVRSDTGTEQVFAAGVRAERGRVRAIMRSDLARGREPLAAHLALVSCLDPEQAFRLLSASNPGSSYPTKARNH